MYSNIKIENGNITIEKINCTEFIIMTRWLDNLIRFYTYSLADGEQYEYMLSSSNMDDLCKLYLCLSSRQKITKDKIYCYGTLGDLKIVPLTHEFLQIIKTKSCSIKDAEISTR